MESEMSNPKIVSVNADSLIKVTFDRGLDDADFFIENIHVEGDEGKYSHAALLKACAKLFIDKASSLECEPKDNNRIIKGE